MFVNLLYQIMTVIKYILVYRNTNQFYSIRIIVKNRLILLEFSINISLKQQNMLSVNDNFKLKSFRSCYIKCIILPT